MLVTSLRYLGMVTFTSTVVYIKLIIHFVILLSPFKMVSPGAARAPHPPDDATAGL